MYIVNELLVFSNLLGRQLCVHSLNIIYKKNLYRAKIFTVKSKILSKRIPLYDLYAEMFARKKENSRDFHLVFKI